MIKKILLALVISVVGLVAVGFAISGNYEVERTITINAKPGDIYPYLADLKKWQDWTAWTTEKYPDMKTEYSGAESGVGAKSAWTGETSGNGKMEITKAEKDQDIEWTLEFEGFPKANGYARLKPVEGDVTRITYGMSGSMGSNPLMKLMVFTMDSAMGAEFDQGLTKLKEVVESQKFPEQERPKPAPPRENKDADETKSADKDGEAAASPPDSAEGDTSDADDNEN